MTRIGSEGSLPAYSAVAATHGRGFGVQERMSRDTFTRVAAPTLIEMEYLGQDLEADQPPPPGTTPVVLPPLPPGMSSVPPPPPPPLSGLLN